MNDLRNTNYLNEEVIRIKLELLGFKLDKKFDLIAGHESPTYIAKQTFKIDPKSLGMFAPAIQEMRAMVVALYDGLSKKIEIKYAYKHPSGSNGYTVTLTNNSNSMTGWVDRSF